jgi:hypothetical protein
MIFALPIAGDTGAVPFVDIREALPKLERTRVALALPKFKFESEYRASLKDALQSLRLASPFQGGICVREGSCSDSIGDVAQKTVIDVNEKGVEAAAVTSLFTIVSMPLPVRPKLFMCDNPFQFFIYDENEDIILFEGIVGNPGLPEDSTGAQFQALHRDAEFWMQNFGVDPIVVMRNETTTQNDTMAGNSTSDTTMPNGTTAGNGTSSYQNDTAAEENITSKNDTSTEDDTTTPNITTTMNETTLLNDTATQEDIAMDNVTSTDPNGTHAGNGTASQNDTLTQEDITKGNGTSTQENTTSNANITEQDDVTIQDDRTTSSSLGQGVLISWGPFVPLIGFLFLSL